MLWGMLNVMQLIVNMPLLNVMFPQNAIMFYGFINDIANFDIIPTDKIKQAIFSFSKEDEPDPNFESMGYESSNIIDNMGSMILYLIGFFALVAFALLIRFLKNKYQM